jgi:hypothetical protein
MNSTVLNLDQFFDDPNSALGFTQGAICRSLDTFSVIPTFKTDRIDYMLNNKTIVIYQTTINKFVYIERCSNNLDRLIRAHAALCG